MFENLERRTMFAATPTILFIRGAVRSGGFLEGTNAETRNEQLADITNTSTKSGNHGWATLAATLRGAGFAVEQMNEPKEKNAPAKGQTAGAPIHFENLNLTKYAAIVFGSNNAKYTKASIEAIDKFIRNGGGALFISDANFGSNWRDAPDSDQQFVGRYGLIVNQDNGKYALTRTGGDFAAPNHPLLKSVNSFDGEGVSPIIVPLKAPAGVTITRIAGARGQTRNNNGTDPAKKYQGTLRNVTSRGASMVAVTAGKGHVVAYFDRNTFFNAGGAGTNINRNNNKQLALNIFNWIAPRPAAAPIYGPFVPLNAISMRSSAALPLQDHLIGSVM